MTTSHCHLTAKDYAYLQALLASRDYDEAFLKLLRRKLAAATPMLDHTIDPRIATIDSRVAFTVGGGFTEERVLTRDEKGVTPNLALPITTQRGLALLGLKEGDVFPLRKANGIIEPIRLIRVAYQPEAARRDEPASAVVSFHPRWVKSLGGAAEPPPDPLNDDPGPGAA